MTAAYAPEAYVFGSPENHDLLEAALIDAAEHLFARALEDAWNTDGTVGLAYTTDWNGRPVVVDRMHWTLAESVNTSAVLATVTDKQEYKDWYATFSGGISTNTSSTTSTAPGSTSWTRTTTSSAPCGPANPTCTTRCSARSSRV